MVFEAEFRHGSPIMVDWTAGTVAISAGEIIDVLDGGLETVIAHKDIPAGEKGAVGAGGGVYKIKVDSNYPQGTKLYWDGANSVGSSTPGTHLGYTLEDAAAANALVDVLHCPAE